MSSSLHSATFTWPASHHSRVFVTGSFDNWSGSTHALTKQDDGSFKGQVEIKYGEKVAYKYVCDGEWMTREDEDKEWDAAGNMNNVYTAPAAPAATAVEKHDEAPVAAAAATTTAPVTAHDETPASAATQPSSLVAAQAPGASNEATTGAHAYGYELGAPVAGGEKASPAAAGTTTTTTLASTAGPMTPEGALAAIKRDEPKESTNTTEAPVTESSTGVSQTAAAWGAGAIAGLTAAAGGLVLAAGDAVHAVTGLDVVHPDPVSVEEAKARGINTEQLPAAKLESTHPAVDVPTAAKKKEASPAVNSLPAPVSAHTDKPSSDLVAAAKEDAQRQLNGHVPQPAVVNMPATTTTSTDRTPASAATASGKDTTPDHFPSNDPVKPAEPTPKHSLPAQDATKEANHQHVPQPVINTISAPLKDRTQPQSEDVAGKPISSDPAASPARAKAEAVSPRADLASQEPSRSYIKKQESTALPLQTTRVPTTGEDAPAKLPPVVAATATPTATAPATPTKSAADLSKRFSTASPSSTAPSTPAKPGQSDSDTMRKRKSSFFSKMKNVFHKKDGQN